MSFIISEKWLKIKLNDEKSKVVVFDVRYKLEDENAGRDAYLKSHIPGAFYLDLKKDLSGEAKKHGGNHPLPTKDEIATTLGSFGVDHHTTVVFYDAGGDMFAPRAWWLFNYMGHEKTYILDGGFNAWIEAGNEVSEEIPKQPKETTYKARVQNEKTVHMEDVMENIKTMVSTLIDSRSTERYLGKEEPLYQKAGHIPGAKNYFWKNVFHEDGTFKSKQKLEEIFHSLSKDERIIVSCGSGVSACANIVGLKLAGFNDVKLYPGSFSDWISYEDNPLVKGEH